MMKIDLLMKGLDSYFPDPKCELNYTKDYELLIATVLSAQCTDKRVNMVTKELFLKYNLKDLMNAELIDIENIIRPCGSFTKKAYYIKSIATSLINNHNGVVPNNRDYLESLPGVGRKTCNVVLSNLFNVPAIAVDTHVARVSVRLGLANTDDTVLVIENKLMKKIPSEKWSRIHHQLVLFGRYKCKAKSPECDTCIFKNDCKYYKKKGD